MASLTALLENPSRRRRRRTTKKRSSSRRRRPAARRTTKRRTVRARRNPSVTTLRKKRRYGSRRRTTYIKRGPRKGQRRGQYGMTTVRRKTRSGRSVRVRKRYYKNPSVMLFNPSRRGRGRVGFLNLIMSTIALGAIGFGGALLSRKVPQMVPFLRGHDAGWKGYGMNLGVGIGAGLLLAKLLRNPDVGMAIALGSAITTVSRVVNDKTPAGSWLHVGASRYRGRMAGVQTWQYGTRGRVSGPYMRRAGSFSGASYGKRLGSAGNFKGRAGNLGSSRYTVGCTKQPGH